MSDAPMMIDLRGEDASAELSEEARATATRLYRAIRIRDERLGTDLFADPAWNILLDLTIAHGRRMLSVSAACLGARSAHATAMRYLTALIKRGIVCREADPTDGRRNFVKLTALGVHRMERILTDFRFQT